MSFAKRSAQQILSQLWKYRVTAPEVSSGFILDFLQSLDCPRALTVAILFREGERERIAAVERHPQDEGAHQQLAELVCDPLHYDSVVRFRDAYTATALLSKYEDLTLGYDKDQKALEKFSKFEDSCRRTNLRFKDLAADPQFRGRTVWLHNAVGRKIDQILGDFSVEEMFSEANWGPGASTLIRRRDASAIKKFQCETGITRDLYDLLPHDSFLMNYPSWAKHLFGTRGERISARTYPSFQVGNKVITVPKDAKANRVIAIEPGLNLWFQLAIGKMIQRRLLRFGVDLRFQNVNQLMAQRGSVDHSLATVDFSSASDSISSGIVEALIPPRWFSVMDSCRSRYGMQSGTLMRWEKFSSMGNGFTFPLESLIFFAVSLCCAEYMHEAPFDAEGCRVSVYGDDVIIPNTCFALFSEVSAFYGFTLNAKKSHFASNFRESCGAHFMDGVDVKPIYLKGRLTDVPSIYRLANNVRRLAHRRGANLFCDACLKPLFVSLVNTVPKACRFRIPDSLGDGGFISNFDEAVPSYARHGVEGYQVTHVVDAPKTRKSEEFGLLLARLWEMPAQETRCIVPLRGLTVLDQNRHFAKYHREHEPLALRVAPGNLIPSSDATECRIARAIVRQWDDLGPWL